MKLFLMGLRGPAGLYSFAISPCSDGTDIIKSIESSLNDLHNEIKPDTVEQILAYLNLLESSSIVKILDFTVDGESLVNSYYLDIFKLTDINIIYDKICMIKDSIYTYQLSKEVDDDGNDF